TASKRLRQASQLSPGIASPRSWGVSSATRRVVLGTMSPGDEDPGVGWRGCLAGPFHPPRVFADERVGGAFRLLAGMFDALGLKNFQSAHLGARAVRRSANWQSFNSSGFG